MANLNLSEFGEKLFVADADHTFIWDTANAISKRVSRNSWLNSGTLTSDAPVTISQTWGNNLVTFTGLKFNAAGTSGTNSAAGSLLADFQLAGVSQFSVTKAGAVNATGAVSTPAQFIAGDAIFANGNGVRYVSTWIRSAGFDGGLLFRNNTQTQSVGVVVEADNTLALRNGAAAQTFNVYGTYTSGTSYERLTLSAPSAANAIIGTNKGSGGGTARGLEFQTDGVTRMTISTAGAVNTTSSIFVGSGVGTGYYHPTFGGLAFQASGVVTVYGGSGYTTFDRLQIGGVTDSYPAIARDGAGIKFTGAAAGLTSWIKVPPVAVSALPLAATAGAGARAFVNDALAPTFGSAVTGGGAVLVPVYSNGSVWNVG